MAGKRYSRDEIDQISALISEGWSNREIASKLGRPEAGIRNIRYRQGLKNKAENETKTLFQQRNRLRLQVSELQIKHLELSNAVDFLEKRKGNAEAFLNLDRLLLRSVLIKALTTLKLERPDLFVLSEQEQILMLTNLFLKRLLS